MTSPSNHTGWEKQTCSNCETVIGPRNKTGLCRPCSCIRNNSDPEMVRRRYEAMVAAVRRPEVREKKRRSRAAQNTPEMRQRWREMGKRNFAITIGSEKAVRRRLSPEVLAKRGRTRSERLMAWCPPQYRDEYRKLARKRRAAEAKAIILAKIQPFELQLWRVSNGASLVNRAVKVTLGGVVRAA